MTCLSQLHNRLGTHLSTVGGSDAVPHSALCAAASHWRCRVPGYRRVLSAATPVAPRLRTGDAACLATATCRTPQRL